MRTRGAAKSQSAQSQNAFEMGEQHFNLLALSSGACVSGRLGDPPRDVACSFVDVSRDLAYRGTGAALRLQRARSQSRCEAWYIIVLALVIPTRGTLKFRYP